MIIHPSGTDLKVWVEALETDDCNTVDTGDITVKINKSV